MFCDTILKLLLNLLQITQRQEWFDWARYSVIEYLFPIGWYNREATNNKFPYPTGMIADTATSKVLAMARFRQLRVKKSKWFYLFIYKLTTTRLTKKLTITVVTTWNENRSKEEQGSKEDIAYFIYKLAYFQLLQD